MTFMNDDHAARWRSALETAHAVTRNGTVNVDFGASLYILTALPSVYDRVDKYICNGWIDFNPMLNGLALSTGEHVMVALAGNLYNGSFFDQYTPMDIVSYCDPDMLELAARALLLRKQRLNINTISDG